MGPLVKFCNSILKRTKVVRDLNEKLDRLADQHTVVENPIILLNNGIKVFVPHQIRDYSQRYLMRYRNFLELDILTDIDPHIPDNASILDIGANIGNHSLYWATQRNAKHIVSFEPIESTFNVLKTNIDINGLSHKVTLNNFALGENKGFASVDPASIVKDPSTVSLVETHGDDSNSGIQIESLDSLDLPLEQIDLMKVDVEGFEMSVLKGGKSTIEKHKPLIFIETFPENASAVDTFLTELGYKKIKSYRDDNYLYKHG